MEETFPSCFSALCSSLLYSKVNELRVHVLLFRREVVSNSVTTWTVYPPGSSVHGILQARVLECVAIPFSRGSSQTRDQTHVSFLGREILYR